MYAIHDRQLAEHGGPEGVRDAGALESALARPRNSINDRMLPHSRWGMRLGWPATIRLLTATNERHGWSRVCFWRSTDIALSSIRRMQCGPSKHWPRERFPKPNLRSGSDRDYGNDERRRCHEKPHTIQQQDCEGHPFSLINSSDTVLLRWTFAFPYIPFCSVSAALLRALVRTLSCSWVSATSFLSMASFTPGITTAA